MVVRLITAGALALTVAVAACGADPEADVRKTLDSFATATAKKDYQSLCERIFSQKLVEQVRQTLPCEVALQRSSLNDAKSPRLEIRRVKVSGDTASAVVNSSAANQKPSEDTVLLVKEHGDWRIQALSS